MFRFNVALAALSFLGGAVTAADPAAPLSALARMPVKEITVFKDGHAFVLHEGRMPTDPAGNVLLDHLPTPVIGTFWPYATDKKAHLTAVTAGRRRVLVPHTALTLRELMEANVGAEVIVTETGTPVSSYPATIVGFPTRSSEELETSALPDSGEVLPQKGTLVLLKTAEGTKVVAFDRIQDVKFIGKYKTTLSDEEFRNLLTLKLDWGGAQPGDGADVGMIYLQKGFRWIPSYKIELDGKGKAIVKLEATLLNEMADMEDVTVNLVVGVPTFLFKDTIDPIALGQTIAGLSPYMEQGSLISNGFSNSMMTQTTRMSESPGPRPGVAPPAGDLGPDVANTGKAEDLFVYTVGHVSLKKGQRLVLPVSQSSMDYADLYSLDIPFTPPPEIRGNLNGNQQAELARLLQAPKAVHKVRLANSSKQPLTTAPALMVQGNRVLAQGMMTYTPVGGSTELTVTTSVDIQVLKTDKESKRTPNAAEWEGQPVGRIDLAGTIHLVNFRAEPVNLEVTRYVLGNVGEADNDGKAEMLNVFEDHRYLATDTYPEWWGWYAWPGWWNHFNGIGRITWKVKLDPGKNLDLAYSWHYYWR